MPEQLLSDTSEQPLYEKYPPLPSILWSIDTPKNLRYPNDVSDNADDEEKKKYQDTKKSFDDNIKKAFRLYVEVISFYDSSSKLSFAQNDFTQSDWITALGGKVANKTIDYWLDFFRVSLNQWFTEFETIFSVQLNESEQKKILSLLPFDCLFEYLEEKISQQKIKESRRNIFRLTLTESEKEKILDSLSSNNELKEKFKNKPKNMTYSEQGEILNTVSFDCLKEILEPRLRDTGKRTFGNDFLKNLAKRGFLKKTPANQRTSTYSKLSKQEIENKLSHFSSSSDLLNELQNIIFDNVLINTSEIFKNTKRFFIKFQHIINRDDIDRLTNIMSELKEKVWDKENKLISIRYASSSQNKTEDLIIYPISLFYNQRTIYLAGYGPTPHHNNKLDFYNYRLDHLEKQLNNNYLIPVEWHEDKYIEWKKQNDPEDQLPHIHYELITKKEEIQQWLSNRIYQELSKALGVDTHRQIKTMLLRFPQEFHKGYIEGTKRHETFTRLQFNTTNNFLSQLEQILVQEQRLRNSQTKITEEDKQLITQIVKVNPNDAYYTMNYRHGKEGGYDVEADVIMRLRAWGHNVEVLFPSDLRKRMKEDYQKAWDIYQD